jgi:hypothetical protein
MKMLILNLMFLSICRIGMSTTVIPPDFKTLVGRADVIFDGEVTQVRSAWVGEGDQRRIKSYITFNLLKVLKGKPESPYVLTLLGGTVGNVTMQIEDVPKFSVGDRNLLFVVNNGKQFCPLVGIMHGYYHIKKDNASGGEEYLLKADKTPLRSIREINEQHESFMNHHKIGQTRNTDKLKYIEMETAIKEHLRSK